MLRWNQRGLRYKLSLVISLTLLVALGFIYIVAGNYIQSQLWNRERNAAKNINAMASVLIEDAMMAGRKDKVQEAINTLGYSIGGQIDSISVYDDQSTLTAFATGFPGGRTIARSSVELGKTNAGCWDCHQKPPSERPTLITVNIEGTEVLRNVVPLVNEARCQTCHENNNEILGDVILDLQLTDYKRTLATMYIGLGIGIVIAISVVALMLYSFMRRIVISPVEDMVAVTQAVVAGNLEKIVQTSSEDEIGKLGKAFNTMTRQLRGLVSNLEQRVSDRTHDIEIRTSYLEASAEVSRRAATVLDPDELSQEIVFLIQERFGLYYVGLFLVSDNREWVILQAGTGSAGETMLARGHRFRMGEGMIGWCVENAQARIALDVGEDAVRFDNPDLPETRSECALPMRARGQIIGALTVQSNQQAAFNREAITVLQVMADQIGIALENAKLYQESQIALESERRAYGILSHQAWQELLKTRPEIGVLATSNLGIQPLPKEWPTEMVEAHRKGEIVRLDHQNISIPIKLRGQVLGAVRLQKNIHQDGWTDDEIRLMDVLIDQLENALESARLYNDTQRSAARERLVTEITTKIRSNNDPDAMLQTAILELQNALQANRVKIHVPPRDSKS